MFFYRSDDEFHHIERKRHEEVDNCPEEIKSMKVACEELSLACTASSEDSQHLKENHATSNGKSAEQKGPKFCLKSLTSQEIPEKDNSIHRHPVDQ